MTGRLRVADGPLNIRATAGLDGDILGTVAFAITGKVTSEMPQDAHGSTWANVQFDNGIRGWVAINFLAWI